MIVRVIEGGVVGIGEGAIVGVMVGAVEGIEEEPAAGVIGTLNERKR